MSALEQMAETQTQTSDDWRSVLAGHGVNEPLPWKASLLLGRLVDAAEHRLFFAKEAARAYEYNPYLTWSAGASEDVAKYARQLALLKRAAACAAACSSAHSTSNRGEMRTCSFAPQH